MSYLDRFHYQLTGLASHPKIMFLHGMMGFTANWRRIAKAFEDQYQVMVFDQRGHGRSMHPEHGYRPIDYADDVALIVSELGWKEFFLVGHSMGGRVAMTYAARNPGRVTRLVIEDIGPSPGPSGGAFIERLLNIVSVPFESKAAARLFFENRFLELLKDQPRRKELAQYLYANMTENDQKQAVWRFSESGVRETIHEGRLVDHWPDIERLTMPTLLIRGSESSDLPRLLFEEMLIRNKAMRGVEIPGAGHWVHSDQPETFISALREFFGDPSRNGT